MRKQSERIVKQHMLSRRGKQMEVNGGKGRRSVEKETTAGRKKAEENTLLVADCHGLNGVLPFPIIPVLFEP